jgi:hypothetical protein
MRASNRGIMLHFYLAAKTNCEEIRELLIVPQTPDRIKAENGSLSRAGQASPPSLSRSAEASESPSADALRRENASLCVKTTYDAGAARGGFTEPVAKREFMRRLRSASPRSHTASGGG